MGGSLNEISDVGPIRAGGRKRTPNVRLQDHGSIMVHRGHWGVDGDVYGMILRIT